MEEQRGGMSALGVETQRRGAGLCGFVGPVKEAGFLQKQRETRLEGVLQKSDLIRWAF